jgi:UDP-3-O-[3-hydroxymyristoyl] glucosamine N-acyltransferase
MDAVAVSDLVAALEGEGRVVNTGSDEMVVGPADLRPGEPGALSFSRTMDASARSAVAATLSSVVLVPAGWGSGAGERAWVIEVDDPRTSYVRALNRFFTPEREVGIHPSAVVSPTAVVGSDVYLGPHVVVSDGVVLGDRCTLHAGVVVMPGVVAGHDLIVGPSSTLGFTGFGYARDTDGTPIPFPHYGGVRIGDRVEIGANTCVDRGTLTDTVIEDDAKIDNLVHIAHNCRIGTGAFVIAHTILCGGVRVGAHAWVAPNSSVIEHVSIGDMATVGLAATVLRDVAPGAVVVGSPAKELPRPTE